MKQLPVVLSQLFCGCCDPESHAALRDRRTAASRAYHGPGHARTLMKLNREGGAIDLETHGSARDDKFTGGGGARGAEW